MVNMRRPASIEIGKKYFLKVNEEEFEEIIVSSHSPEPNRVRAHTSQKKLIFAYRENIFEKEPDYENKIIA